MSAAAPRVLLLGGSAEGFAIAEALVARGVDVITSFAGRTQTRRAPAGIARVGGFGGAKGLAVYLAVEDIALVIDATHPFAAKIKENAGGACAETGTQLISVDRPAWTAEPGDDWRPVPSLAAAARLAPATEGACFLTIGRQEIRHFESRHDLDLVIRVIDPPDAPFAHPRAAFIFDRGPFDLEAERALFAQRRIRCVVTKNSGAEAASAKLTVARELGLPVVMVERAAKPQGVVVSSAAAAVTVATAMLGAAAA